MVNTMENAEEVMQILDRFTRLKQKEIPKELDDYLQYVAKTGDTIFKWSSLKYLFREKLLNVIKHFHDTTPRVDEIPQYPNVDPFNYESMKASLLERLELFNAAPFTIQRLCELLIDPRKQYSRIDKFMRALEKNILVVSTVEPGRKRSESENGDSLDSVVNGDLSLDVNVDIDMENDGLFALEGQNGNGAVPAVVAAAVDALAEVKDKLTSPALVDNVNSTARTGDDDILPHPKKAKLELNDNEPKVEVAADQAQPNLETIAVEAKNGTEQLKPKTAVDGLEAETKPVEQNNCIKPEASNGNVSEIASTESAEQKVKDIEMTTKEEKPVEEMKTEESAVKKDVVDDKIETALVEQPENKKTEDKTETTVVKEVKENHAENEKITEACKKTEVEEIAQEKVKEVETKLKPVEDKVDCAVAAPKEIVVEQQKVLKVTEEISVKEEAALVEKEKAEILPKQEDKEKVIVADNKQTANVVLENGNSNAAESTAAAIPAVAVELTKVEEKTDDTAINVVKDTKIEAETKLLEEEPKQKKTEKIEQNDEKKAEIAEATTPSSIINEEKTEKPEEVTENVIATVETTVEPSQPVEPAQTPVVVKDNTKAENKTEGEESAKAVVDDVKIEKTDTTAAIATAEIVAAVPAAVIEEPMPIEADSPVVAGIDIDELPAIAVAAAELVTPLPDIQAAESIITPTLALNDQPMEDLPMEEAAPEEVIMTDSVVPSGLVGLVEMSTEAMEATSKDEPPVDGMDVDDTSQEAMDQ